MGINTLVFNTENFPVPNEWIFEKLLNLDERLKGQSITVNSVFNTDDKTPSMTIYLHDNGKYKFKDFSTGKSGDAVDFIQEIYNLSTRNEAFKKAYSLWKSGDFEAYVKIKLVKSTYEISKFKIREWNTNDVKYWTKIHIGSKELERYNVKPLSSYTFKVTTGDIITEKAFSKSYCYGYFKEDGTIYKIYNPKEKRTKFIKVKDYIQGHEQLTFKKDWLIILSSLKDIMAFGTLKFKKIECVAPDSENVMITQAQIDWYLKRYKYVSVLFDNDSPGKKSALKYKDKYRLRVINFDVEKDIAECVEQHTPRNTRLFMTPHLTEIMKHLKNDKKRT